MTIMIFLDDMHLRSLLFDGLLSLLHYVTYHPNLFDAFAWLFPFVFLGSYHTTLITRT